MMNEITYKIVLLAKYYEFILPSVAIVIKENSTIQINKIKVSNCYVK